MGQGTAETESEADRGGGPACGRALRMPPRVMVPRCKRLTACAGRAAAAGAEGMQAEPRTWHIRAGPASGGLRSPEGWRDDLLRSGAGRSCAQSGTDESGSHVAAAAGDAAAGGAAAAAAAAAAEAEAVEAAAERVAAERALALDEAEHQHAMGVSSRTHRPRSPPRARNSRRAAYRTHSPFRSTVLSLFSHPAHLLSLC